MAKKTDEKPSGKESVSKSEQVGYHKGSLTVLAKERQELSRILGIVEQLMQMHMAALKDLGVTIEGEALDTAPKASPGKPKDKPPIEDII